MQRSIGVLGGEDGDGREIAVELSVEAMCAAI
jgi:hypothetical protein